MLSRLVQRRPVRRLEITRPMSYCLRIQLGILEIIWNRTTIETGAIRIGIHLLW